MFKVKQEMFVYIDDANRMGECRVDILVGDDQRWIVVLTELRNRSSNSFTGPSVTNAMEYIIDQFCSQNDLKFPEEVDFLERYETHPEYLDKVRITQMGTDWQRVSDEVAAPILELL